MTHAQNKLPGKWAGVGSLFKLGLKQGTAGP